MFGHAGGVEVGEDAGRSPHIFPGNNPSDGCVFSCFGKVSSERTGADIDPVPPSRIDRFEKSRKQSVNSSNLLT